jgi:hypothetical protein
MEKYPHIEGFGDYDNWNATDVERYRDDLVLRGILDVESPLDDNCPACGSFGWEMNFPRQCLRCAFGLVRGQPVQASEVRKRAFLHRVTIFEPLRRDPFSVLNAQHLGDLTEATNQRVEAIATIGRAYRISRRLLFELGIGENVQASQMLCVTLGAIAMHNFGIDDPEWLIDEVARRLPGEDRSVEHADVRARLRDLCREVCRLTEAADIGGTCHLCQVAFIHHFANYAKASRHQVEIVKGVAEMVAHTTMASNLKATLSRSTTSPTNQISSSGCMVLLLAGGAAASAVKALIGSI